MRFPHLAHRSAAAHKLHSTPQQDRINLISGNDQTSSRLPAFSLFLPGSCPNNRDRRTLFPVQIKVVGQIVLLRARCRAGFPRKIVSSQVYPTKFAAICCLGPVPTLQQPNDRVTI
jgi:hypothetical protein